jgi:Cu2+-exporting ATPase
MISANVNAAMNSIAPEFGVDTHCYHCGLPALRGLTLSAVIDGRARVMCCAGCKAVAETVVASGLEDYYQKRDAMPGTPRDMVPAFLRELELYDQPAVQAHLVSGETPDHPEQRAASLLLDGITCGACIWLIERRVQALPGMVSIAVNYATRRARVVWDARRIPLSAILRAIASIGYRATPYDASHAEAAYRAERNDALKRLFVAGFGMMQVMMYAVPAYLADEGSMSAGIEQLMRLASLILTLPVVFYSAWPLIRNAMRDIRAGRAGMDVPVALGIGVAFAASTVATLGGGGEVYFDSIAMFVFLLLAARFFEFLARRRAAAGLERLAHSAPAIAQRLVDYPRSLETECVVAATLIPEDLVQIAPGENIPADGIVVAGRGTVDESLLTGESRPLRKDAGSALTGGAINLDAPLVMRVTQAGDATRLSAIVRLLERALCGKPSMVVLADRVAAWFVTVLLLVALATGAAWLAIDPARAPWVVVAVLVVTCPCALSLATPAALTAATARLAAIGVLVTRGHAIETLARADCFVFDKTGTLTEGNMRVVRTLALGTAGADACTRLAASLEQGIEHPIARAIRDAAKEAAGDAALAVPSDLRVVQGAGIEATIAGKRLRLGAPAFVAEFAGSPLPAESLQHGAVAESVVLLAQEDSWLAAFALGDALREGATELIDGLQRANRRVALYSGDAERVVGEFAAAAHITDWRGGLSPEDKHAAVQALQQGGAVVAMIGDGVNDAPVLAQAQVSVAIGSGAALAQASADMVLLNANIGVLAEAVELARQTMRVIRQNLVWAIVYNGLALPLAIGGWLTPWLAGLGMATSSLLVVLNAMRLSPHAPAARQFEPA